jgi:SWI/SNF-related matrix-associated actin-dependent regulator of chromatin subfamily A member 5
MIETIFSAACAEYCCIDSDTIKIDEHNKPGSEKLVFYLTKCASGLGINLTTVDIIALHDSGW